MTIVNIERISFLRHAHSDLAGGDEGRVLSAKGLTQAFNMKKLVTMDYDLVICSTAKRTIETAEILLMASQKNIKLLKIKSLYLPLDDGDINDISKMLTMHPYATPKEMLSYDKAGAWDRYADNAYDDIINAAHENQSSRLLIIGHSTITNLLGVKFGGNVDPLMSFMIGSCQGFSVICNKEIE
jgi:broad specificity phosphatase PhoE